MSSRLVVVVGLSIGLVGFLVAVVGDNRPLGFGIFLAGFVVGVAGAAWGILNIPEVGQSGQFAKPLRLAAIGFVIAVLGNFLSFVGAPDSLTTILLILGFSVMAVGIVLNLFRISRSQ